MDKNFLKRKVINCKDTKEVCEGYLEYLKSEHWRNLRKNMLEKYNYKCQKCKKVKDPQYLQIHHKSYKNLGHEHKSDIILLCEKCHKKEHEMKQLNKKMRVHRRKSRLDKHCCRWNDVGNCTKFHCRCFDCKEYKTNKKYTDYI